ncbi:MAG: CBS domain-containing protein [Pyrinomonadaceae bacterium]|nr:CBS domain-containing protein [Pyrinomonadaceae bacterium]
MNLNENFQSARDLMETNIVFIDGLATAKEAVRIMREKNVESLIVNKRNEQDAYGIVVIQDLILGAILPQRPAEKVNVFEIMKKPVVTVPPDMDIRYVARLLIRLGLRSAPVEENGEYIGMISLSRIILKNVLF